MIVKNAPLFPSSTASLPLLRLSGEKREVVERRKSVMRQNDADVSAVNHLTIKRASIEWDIKLSSASDIIVC